MLEDDYVCVYDCVYDDNDYVDCNYGNEHILNLHDSTCCMVRCGADPYSYDGLYIDQHMWGQ